MSSYHPPSTPSAAQDRDRQPQGRERAADTILDEESDADWVHDAETRNWQPDGAQVAATVPPLDVADLAAAPVPPPAVAEAVPRPEVVASAPPQGADAMSPDAMSPDAMSPLHPASRPNRPLPAGGISAGPVDVTVALPVSGDARAPGAHGNRGVHDQHEDMSPHALHQGTRIGRYVIGERLGAGGIGVAYRAYDPEFNRHIALKLLHAGDQAARVQTRLLQQARALAQLPGSDVVKIYDVGLWHESVFVAMEWIPGPTLRDWLAAGARSPAEIVGVFRAAGAGLAAAHRAGLLHSDFRPDNVVCGTDGRVCVLDFGLVRALGGGVSQPMAAVPSPDAPVPAAPTPPVVDAAQQVAAGSPTPVTPDPAADPNRLDFPLTILGKVIGTPAYMAPEQHLGASCDARTDQFGFCVALYRALYGIAPFAGTSLATLRRSVLTGQVTPPPAGTQVPARVRDTVLRGLEVDANKRYPTMEDLLADLTPTRRRPVALVLALSVLLILGIGGIGILGFTLGGDRDAAHCQGGEQRLSAVWNDAVQASIRDAFVATERSHAATTAKRVTELLADYSRSWLAMRVQACEATRVRREQSAALLDLRMSCLASRLDALQGLTRVLTQEPDVQVVDRAIEASLRLPELDSCADADALQQAYPLPQDAEQRATIRALNAQLDEAGAMAEVGRHEAALAQLEQLVPSAMATEFPPLQAKVHAIRARSLRLGLHPPREIETELHTAALYAGQARDDRLLARIWIELIFAVGYLQGRYDDAFTLLPTAEAALARAGASPKLKAQLLRYTGMLYAESGDLSKARALHQQALDIATEIYGQDNIQLRPYLDAMGATNSREGKFGDSQAIFERLVQLIEKQFGLDHVFLSEPLDGLAAALGNQGDYEGALRIVRRALDIAVASRGQENIAVVGHLGHVGMRLFQLGRYDEAATELGRAYDIAVRLQDLQRPASKNVINYLIQVLLTQGEYQRADEYVQQFASITRNSTGTEARLYAYALWYQARVLEARDQYREALRRGQRALEIMREVRGNEHRDTADMMVGVGMTLRDKGDYEDARSYLQDALDVMEQATGPDDLAVGSILVELAALVLLEEQYAESQRLYQRARTILANTLPDAHPLRAAALTGVGESLLGQDRARPALPLLRQALQLRDGSSVDPVATARTRFALARALRQGRRNRARAVRLAEAARDVFAAAGPRAEPLLAQANIWLRQNGR